MNKSSGVCAPRGAVHRGHRWEFKWYEIVLERLRQVPWLGIPQKRVWKSRVDDGACCCLALSLEERAVVARLRGSFPVTLASMKQLV